MNKEQIEDILQDFLDKVVASGTVEDIKNAVDTADNVRKGTKRPTLGCVLAGVSIFSQRGAEDWFDFPRYKVVAEHMNGEKFFVDTLNDRGESLGYGTLRYDSDQWKLWEVT